MWGKAQWSCQKSVFEHTTSNPAWWAVRVMYIRQGGCHAVSARRSEYGKNLLKCISTAGVYSSLCLHGTPACCPPPSQIIIQSAFPRGVWRLLHNNAIIGRYHSVDISVRASMLRRQHSLNNRHFHPTSKGPAPLSPLRMHPTHAETDNHRWSISVFHTENAE